MHLKRPFYMEKLQMFYFIFFLNFLRNQTNIKLKKVKFFLYIYKKNADDITLETRASKAMHENSAA